LENCLCKMNERINKSVYFKEIFVREFFELAGRRLRRYIRKFDIILQLLKI
jgi:hypothetical protein